MSLGAVRPDQVDVIPRLEHDPRSVRRPARVCPVPREEPPVAAVDPHGREAAVPPRVDDAHARRRKAACACAGPEQPRAASLYTDDVEIEDSSVRIPGEKDPAPVPRPVERPQALARSSGQEPAPALSSQSARGRTTRTAPPTEASTEPRTGAPTRSTRLRCDTEQASRRRRRTGPWPTAASRRARRRATRTAGSRMVREAELKETGAELVSASIRP